MIIDSTLSAVEERIEALQRMQVAIRRRREKEQYKNATWGASSLNSKVINRKEAVSDFLLSHGRDPDIDPNSAIVIWKDGEVIDVIPLEGIEHLMSFRV